MDRPISTKVHGVLDYLTAPTLLALPRIMGWGPMMTGLLTGAGVGLLGYSVMTRYELGLFKVIPMKVHLVLDAMSGAMLAAAPFVLAEQQERDATMMGVMAGLGAFEVGAALLTKTEPPLTEREPFSKVKELVTSGS